MSTDQPSPSPQDEPRRGEVTGRVDRIVYTNPENEYTVAIILPEGARDEVTVVGPLAGLRPEQTLKASGTWVEDKRFGRQLRADSFEILLPDTAAGIEAYLSSGFIRGIGPTYAKRLVARFGTELFEIMDNAPERLRTVEGIGPKRYEMIRRGWEESRTLRRLVLFLQNHGISSSYAGRLYKMYGEEAVTRIERNPYQLALDIRGIGFKSADRIAQKLGVPVESMERVKAGVYFQLQDLAGDGHSFFPPDPLIERSREALTVPDQMIVDALNALKREGHIALEVLGDGTKAVYLRALAGNESSVAERLMRIARTGKLLPKIDAPAEIARFEEQYRFELGPRQREAVVDALRGGVVVMTGGPGTGKTTTIRAILRILERFGISVALCAPTGRAAKRMHEATGKPATTIHRLLEYSGKTASYGRNVRNPIKADFIIVDETSMVDIALADSLIRAVAPQSSLIFVGDSDQLPSVGPGNFLRDLIASTAVPVVRLDVVFRQAQRSLIVTNAHRINQGLMPTLTPDIGDTEPDFLFIERDEPEAILRDIIDLVSRDLPRRHKLDPAADIQVLAPMHRGVIGAQNLNRSLQEILNPGRGGVTRGQVVFRAGDKIMQVENDYDKDVFNGDIGIIDEVDGDNQVIRVLYDDRGVLYDFNELHQIEPAYAITIHKSQGSEYPAVVIPVHTTHYVMLHRNLVYTALTRGKRLVVIVGQQKALRIAINSAGSGPRHSGLAQRLRSLAKQGSGA